MQSTVSLRFLNHQPTSPLKLKIFYIFRRQSISMIGNIYLALEPTHLKDMSELFPLVNGL